MLLLECPHITHHSVLNLLLPNGHVHRPLVRLTLCATSSKASDPPIRIGRERPTIRIVGLERAQKSKDSFLHHVGVIRPTFLVGLTHEHDIPHVRNDEPVAMFIARLAAPLELRQLRCRNRLPFKNQRVNRSLDSEIGVLRLLERAEVLTKLDGRHGGKLMYEFRVLDRIHATTCHGHSCENTGLHQSKKYPKCQT